ncbi:MAG: glycosyltransferase [Aquamicrobium sp.]|uniref:glycosyltransferase family 2 protein n=1 Tax=Aquamicrobium sp. TaxID=1872579 RepID=UPI00349E8AE6|nr:glycosyltransferase [Aquamicrobium sp.]
MHDVSVVIPVRNGEDHVVEAVESALAQGDAVIEVIVVDDGSSDRTVERVAALADPRIRLVTDRPAGRSGVSAVRNYGFAGSRGEWVLFLDADDRLREGAVARLIEGADDPRVAAVYGDYERIDGEGATVGWRRLLRHRAKPSGDIVESLLAGNFIVNGGIMLIRAANFREIGGFDESLRYCEDWHAWCRLATTGEMRFRQGLGVLDYRVHSSSTMMAKTLTMDDYLPALDAIFSDPHIVRAVPAERRAGLRAKAHAHLNAYLIGQSLRAGRYGTALSGLAATLARQPRALPRALLVSAAALAGL